MYMSLQNFRRLIIILIFINAATLTWCIVEKNWFNAYSTGIIQVFFIGCFVFVTKMLQPDKTGRLDVEHLMEAYDQSYIRCGYEYLTNRLKSYVHGAEESLNILHVNNDVIKAAIQRDISVMNDIERIKKIGEFILLENSLLIAFQSEHTLESPIFPGLYTEKVSARKPKLR